MELFAAERMCPQINRCCPNPHRGQHLHQGEFPICGAQLHPLKEHHKCVNDKRSWGKVATSIAQGQDDRFDHLVISGIDGSDHLADEYADSLRSALIIRRISTRNFWDVGHPNPISGEGLEGAIEQFGTLRLEPI